MGEEFASSPLLSFLLGGDDAHDDVQEDTLFLYTSSLFGVPGLHVWSDDILFGGQLFQLDRDQES